MADQQGQGSAAPAAPVKLKEAQGIEMPSTVAAPLEQAGAAPQEAGGLEGGKAAVQNGAVGLLSANLTAKASYLPSSTTLDTVTVSAPPSPATAVASPSPAAAPLTMMTARASTPSGSAAASGSSHAQHQRRERGPKQMKRNIDRVFYGSYDIKTWYFSPYPFDEDEWASMAGPSSRPALPSSTPPAHVGKKKGRVPSGAAAASAAAAAARRSLLAQSSPLAQSHGQPGAAVGTSSPTVTGTEPVPVHPPGALSTSAAQAPALPAILPSAASSSSRIDGAPSPLPGPIGSTNATPAPVLHQPAAKALWVCDGCFKYMRTYAGHRAHKKECKYTHPPGRKVYQRGAHIIWEVDGAKEKLYAQNLCLFGKLFIDHKTIYFDVEPFVFYILTDASPSFDHVLGFFSKEKISYDDYNLACIITFPPFQKKGYGTLMIEFSYYLSSLTQVIGTPERPLSDLGFRGYLAFWSASVLRALAIAFNEDDVDVMPVLFAQGTAIIPATSPQAGKQLELPSESSAVGGPAASPSSSHSIPRRLRLESMRIRRTLLGLAPLPSETSTGVKRAERPSSGGGEDQAATDDEDDDEAKIRAKRLRRASRGWAGEIPRSIANASTSGTARTRAKLEGKASSPSAEQGTIKVPASSPPTSTVPLPPCVVAALDTNHGASSEQGQMALCTTLERISRATNLRTDDVAFALAECGLLRRRARVTEQGTGTVGKRIVSFGLEGGTGEGGAIVRNGGGERTRTQTQTQTPVNGLSNGHHEEDGAAAKPPIDAEPPQKIKLDGPAQGPGSGSGSGAGSSPTQTLPALEGEGEGVGEGETAILITRQAVKEALLSRKVRRPVLDTDYALL